MNTNITEEMLTRICSTCDNVLKIRKEIQRGWYCCDEYYCTEKCLNKSFKGSGTNWLSHYDDDGDCYWTEWEE